MIFVAGSANLDFVIRAARIPAAGETVIGHDLKTYPGGKGANQAVASARAGNVATTMLLALGDDACASPIETSLSAAGVSTHIVRVVGQPTGSAFICVSDAAENAIVISPGANWALSAAHLPSLTGFTHLLLQLEIPLRTVIDFARAAKSAGVKVVLNAAPAQSLPPELLSLLDILIVNESELAEISGRTGTIAQRLQRIDTPCAIVTLGEQGCMACVGRELIVKPAFRLLPVDTTAAGDTFCGVLTAALGEDSGLAEALRIANAAAALACTRPGAQSSIPTQREVQEFLAAHDAERNSLD